MHTKMGNRLKWNWDNSNGAPGECLEKYTAAIVFDCRKYDFKLELMRRVTPCDGNNGLLVRHSHGGTVTDIIYMDLNTSIDLSRAIVYGKTDEEVTAVLARLDGTWWRIPRLWHDLTEGEQIAWSDGFYALWDKLVDAPRDTDASTPWGCPWTWCPDEPIESPARFFKRHFVNIKEA